MGRDSESTTQLAQATQHFLQVFDHLDWESFRATWSSNPSVFFPFDDTPETVIGRAAVEERFRRFFDEVRSRVSGPPYLHIKPRDLRFECYADAGLVTFVLDQPKLLAGPPVGRRTLLFVREADGWKLSHLHASAAGQRA